MEKKKLGRPTENKKTGRFELRTTEEEERMLDYCCKVMGSSRASVMRMGLKKLYEELKLRQ